MVRGWWGRGRWGRSRRESVARWPGARAADRLRVAARAWVVLAGLAFLGLAYRRVLPAAADFGEIPRAIALPAQAGLLGLALLGVLVAWRWEAAGLVVVAVAATLLGFIAWAQYPPLVAALVTAALAAPIGLLWLAHQRTRPLRPLATFTALTAVLVAGLGVGADRLYGYFYGPTHPPSAAQRAPVDRVAWSWAGALTPTSFTVTARLAGGARQARLAVGTDAELRQPVYSPAQPATEDTGRAVRLTATGLRPGTRYFYGVEVDGRLDRVARGRVGTAPAGPASFRFAFGACARTGSSGSVFDAVRGTDPLLYLNLGDMFYGDVDTDDLAQFRRLYDATLSAPAQAELYRSTATGYVWDDHDFGPNNADGQAPSRLAASRAYRETVPHYPLAAGADGSIYQAFTIGRVRFLLTDSRTGRASRDALDDDRKTALGAAQRAWLEAELRSARDRYPLVVWANPIPWIEDVEAGSDAWGGYSTERRRLSDLIAAAGIRNLLMISGDAHMLAIDDGSHSDYSARGGAGFPVFHAAPLDRPGAVKGGPYSHGTRTEGGQFGLVSVDDPGAGPVTVTLSGRTYTGAEVMRHRFTSPRG